METNFKKPMKIVATIIFIIGLTVSVQKTFSNPFSSINENILKQETTSTMRPAKGCFHTGNYNDTCKLEYVTTVVVGCKPTPILHQDTCGIK